MMRALRPHLLSLVILGFALAAAGCQRTSQPNTLDRLHPCATEEGPGDAYCGTLSVFENRQTRTGRQIKLTIVVLPAVSSDEKPDPLFFLAGGPGQAAAQMAPAIKQTFGRIQRTRDIVLVDQR